MSSDAHEYDSTFVRFTESTADSPIHLKNQQQFWKAELPLSADYNTYRYYTHLRSVTDLQNRQSENCNIISKSSYTWKLS